ncbi:MAG: imidazoleglycerol-phosphate dehydratase [Myxococcaceae bacterium]
MTRLVRETKETRVEVDLSRTGGEVVVSTGKPFFDHMLQTLARYAGFGLKLSAKGDLVHHLMEDVALALGEALRREIPETAARYGERTLPMDEVLVQVAVDVGGRFYYRGKLPSRLYEHVMRSLADAARITLHVRVVRSGNRHHTIEGAFKALGLALRQAMADSGAVFSTKGSVSLEVK